MVSASYPQDMDHVAYIMLNTLESHSTPGGRFGTTCHPTLQQQSFFSLQVPDVKRWSLRPW